MKTIDELSSQVFRVEPLAGCGNLLSFTEWLATNLSQGDRQAWSLLYLDVNHMRQANAEHGSLQGDNILRWIALVLQDDTGLPVYRVGGDEFAVPILAGDRASRQALAQQVYDHLNADSGQFVIAPPPASIALIHYAPGEQPDVEDVWIHLGNAMRVVKNNRGSSFRVFDSPELSRLFDPEAVRQLVRRLVDQVVDFGRLLDETQNLVYTDPVTELPNSRAANRVLEEALVQARSTGQPLSLLWVDGDNLRDYNHISYKAGDDMVQQLGAVLNANLRPNDFLARWRVGDEFLIVLPGLCVSQALLVGERLRAAVQQVSQDWRLPVTISVGIACYPEQGEAAGDLFLQAEKALESAKNSGKNQVRAG